MTALKANDIVIVTLKQGFRWKGSKKARVIKVTETRVVCKRYDRRRSAAYLPCNVRLATEREKIYR